MQAPLKIELFSLNRNTQSFKITLKIYQQIYPASKAIFDALSITNIGLHTTQWGEKLEETFLICAHASIFSSLSPST